MKAQTFQKRPEIGPYTWQVGRSFVEFAPPAVYCTCGVVYSYWNRRGEYVLYACEHIRAVHRAIKEETHGLIYAGEV